MPLGIQNMIWSVGVQHGAGGARNLFKNAGIKSGDNWETILKKVYNERMKVEIYFKSSYKDLGKGLKARFQSELNDALKQINQAKT